MKPKNWRRYYGYRPAPLSNPPKDPQVMREEYAAWLVAQSRAATQAKAFAYIDAMPSCGLVAQHNGGELGTYERQVKHFGAGVCVRVVPCFTKASGVYMPDSDTPRGNGQGVWVFPEDSATWQRGTKTGGSGVTVYWVMVDGRSVDSFLSSAAATRKARELAEPRLRAALAQPPEGWQHAA